MFKSIQCDIRMQPHCEPESPKALEQSLGKNVISMGLQDRLTQGPPLQDQDSEGL